MTTIRNLLIILYLIFTINLSFAQNPDIQLVQAFPCQVAPQVKMLQQMPKDAGIFRKASDG